MPRDLSDPASVASFLREHPICALYFTTPDCGVCKVLKPKLAAMLAERFPAVGFAQVDCAAAPALSADMGVFAVPALIVFTEGRESLRKSRSFGLEELAAALERPYGLLYGE
jgi:thiol-disulfide isomerase/thioredoxin